MGLMFIGIILDLLGAFYMHYHVTVLDPNSMSNTFSAIVFFFWVISFIGGVLVLLGKRKVGAIMVIIGSVIFAPLGAIAIIGALKAKTPDETESDLDIRRQLANTSQKGQRHE